MKADLHMHSTRSDGSDTPEELFQMASESGIEAIAITDHDTLAGIEENMLLSQKWGVHYIPAVEVSAYDPVSQKKCHIVGLFVEPGHVEFDRMIEKTTTERHEIAHKQVQMLSKLGFDIHDADFRAKRGAHGYYKQHIMQVLIEKGYTDELFGDFYRRYFKDDGPLNISVDYPDAKDAVRLLAEMGALPVLAHPLQYGNMKYLVTLIEAGLKGIEVCYPSCSAAEHQQLKQVAKDHRLFASGGSDHHGIYTDEPFETFVGYSTVELPEEILERIV